MTEAKGVYKQAIDDNMILPMEKLPSFEDLSEEFPDEVVPYLDRKQGVDEQKLSTEQKFWRENGYLILSNFIPEELVDAYLDLRKRANVMVDAWGTATPYMFFEEIKDLCLYKPLTDMMRLLVGDELGMHFNIPAFQSTQRGWHQDDYLNPPDVYSWYAAVWFAVGDIHPDCGPFQYVPGSHKWPCMRSDKVKQFLVPEARGVWGDKGQKGHWAQHAEVFTTPAYIDKLERSKAPIKTFLGKKGDVLIWHGRLLHRGSYPNDPTIQRPGLITHYSRISTRRDIGNRIRQHKDGGYYWQFPQAFLRHGADTVNMERQIRLLASYEDRIQQLEEEVAKYRKLKKKLRPVIKPTKKLLHLKDQVIDKLSS